MSDERIAAAEAKLQDLLRRSEQAMGQFGQLAVVSLVMKGAWGARTTARLWGRAGGPAGRIVADHSPGRIVVQFRAADIQRECRKKLAELGGAT